MRKTRAERTLRNFDLRRPAHAPRKPEPTLRGAGRPLKPPDPLRTTELTTRYGSSSPTTTRSFGGDYTPSWTSTQDWKWWAKQSMAPRQSTSPIACDPTWC